MMTLRFAGDGSFLFHDRFSAVCIWHHRRFVRECPGRFVGAARDGQSFLTYNEADQTFTAWQSASGEPIALSAINPEGYAHNQRYHIEAKRLTLTFRDALGLEKTRALNFGAAYGNSEYAACDNWGLSSNGRLLAIAFFMEAGGHDGAYGQCFELDRAWQPREKFRFKVNRFVHKPLVIFCEPHSLLAVSSSSGSFFLFQTGGKHIQTLKYELSGGDFLAASPARKDVYALHHDQQIWRLYEGRRQRDVQEEKKTLAAAFHPGGNQIAVLLEDQVIRIYEVRTLSLLDELKVPTPPKG